MSVISIILFFIYTYGLGFSITSFLKDSANFFERNLMRIGIGLGTLPFLFVLFNLLRIPIDWKIVLLVSLVVPSFAFVNGIKKGLKMPSIKLGKSTLYVFIVLLVSFLTLFMYVKGAFKYPYFEDDDPWPHAVGIKYVSIEKNVDDPTNTLVYIKPYPPGYDALMGILHQTSPSLMWTMKFFNALIISLGIIFFYFLTKNFMQSKDKALLATVVLAMVPCYLSHFIWAHSLVMTSLIVALYCLIMIDSNKKWLYPCAIVITGISMTQPSKPIKFFFIFVIYVVVKSVYSRKLMIRESLAVVIGYLLSLLWWGTNWTTLFTAQIASASRKMGISATESTGNIIARFWGIIRRTFAYNSGTATRAYTFSDFFFAKSQNMINNPVGVGIVLCLLVLFALVLVFLTYKSMKTEKKMWVVTTLFWLVFTFLGINSMTFHLPIGFFAFRFWMLFAIPVSILAAEGIWFLARLFRQFGIPNGVTIALLVILIFFTAGQQKYAVNTAMWGPGQSWTSMDEVAGYSWLKTLPVDTNIFAYSGDEAVIGFDKFSCLWCEDVISFREGLLYRNVSEVYDWLKRKRYEYLIIDGMTYKNFGELLGENKTKELLSQRLEEIRSLGNFQVAYQTNGAIIFKLM